MHKKNKYLVIADYNLTRVNDVRMMTGYARSNYGAKSILLRSQPTRVDYEIADVVIDLDPRSPQFVEKALAELKPYMNQIKAVMPFSDNAVQSGAKLAENLHVIADSGKLADAAYSKIRYRQRETELKEYLQEQGVFVPRFSIVDSIEQIREFAKYCSNGFVLKPSCEGNNRGVLKLDGSSDMERAFDEVKPYLKDGIICEEMITFPFEYSFDGIGHLSFVTKKQSRTSLYPVEFGQIVPAVIPTSHKAAIERAGRVANFICGQHSGPYHNEIKLNPFTLETAVIEPNRRPAGMKIWHLANRVFNVNLFELWIDQLFGTPLPASLPKPVRLAAIHELPPPRHGCMVANYPKKALEEEILSEILEKMPDIPSVAWENFSLHCNPSGVLNPDIHDNSGFAAEVCCIVEDMDFDIQAILKDFEDTWMSVATKYMEESRYENISAESHSLQQNSI